MSPASIDARFIEGLRGKLFVLLRKPRRQETGRCVLIVPPFAEEMNKSRRMFTEVAQGLVARGVAAVLPDLYGTGDSEGEFREADWEVWKDDLVRTASWAAEQGWAVSALLCLRLGCILGAQVAATLPQPLERSVFWQPVLDGERFMTQFLRLRVAASMMEDRKESVTNLRARLRRGEYLEVAGYELDSRILEQVDQARLGAALHEQLGELYWMEIVRDADLRMPASSAKVIEGAAGKLRSIRGETVAGEPFWASTEIVRLPALVERTVRALDGTA